MAGRSGENSKRTKLKTATMAKAKARKTPVAVEEVLKTGGRTLAKIKKPATKR